MKKLVAMLGAVAFAAVAQAASVDWTATALYTYNGTETVSASGSRMIAYVFFSDSADTLTSTMGTLSTALAKGDLTGLSGAAGSKANYTGTAWNNKINASESYITGLAAGDTYGQIVFFNAETADDATYFYVSNMATATLDAENPTTMAFLSQKTAMSNASNWTAVSDVPEPTSGILLLLGMAGLALRRKRA